MVLLAEVGVDLSKFPSAKHFVSWLSLCPNTKKSGGKVLSSKTRKNNHRLAHAFRQAAFAIGKQKGTVLSSFYRRMVYRKGEASAIVATANKLAVIVYTMLQNKEQYQPQGLEEYQNQVREQKLKNIQRTIQKLQIKKEELSFN